MNAAALYKYKNLQQQIYQSAALITVNAAAARITGLDLDLQARPISNFTVALGDGAIARHFLLAISSSFCEREKTIYIQILSCLAPAGQALKPGNCGTLSYLIFSKVRGSLAMKTAYVKALKERRVRRTVA